ERRRASIHRSDVGNPSIQTIDRGRALAILSGQRCHKWFPEARPVLPAGRARLALRVGGREEDPRPAVDAGTGSTRRRFSWTRSRRAKPPTRWHDGTIWSPSSVMTSEASSTP